MAFKVLIPQDITAPGKDYLTFMLISEFSQEERK